MAWALLYGFLLITLNHLITGSWLPPADARGMWFYTAAVSLIFGDLLIHPYFVAPKDTLTIAVISAIAVWFVAKDPTATHYTVTIAVLSFCLIAAVVAATAIFTKGKSNPPTSIFAQVAKELATTLGHPKLILTAVFFVALLAYHLDSPIDTAFIVITWAVLIGVEPERPLYWMWRRLRPGSSRPKDFGTIAAYQTPNILLIRHEYEKSAIFGDYLICRDARGPASLAIALDHIGRDQALLLRSLQVVLPTSLTPWLETSGRGIGPDRVGRLPASAVTQEIVEKSSILERLDRLLGIVDEHTDIETLYFEVIQPHDIAEGSLIQVEIRGNPVVYQVTNGVTKEEVVHQRHTHGYARAEATKVGIWVAEKRKFARATWLPQLNSPVTAADPVADATDEATVGHFPHSNYPVEIADIHDLVTHNTAILGILGIGKSMLAIELVERMLAADIKVVCLDLTDQYATALADWHNPGADSSWLEQVVKAGKKDQDTITENPEDGGSFPNIKAAIQQQLEVFMQAGDRRLMILNPARLAATRQDAGPRSYQDRNGKWQRVAPLWSVTPVQMTQVVSETLLALVQDEMRNQARVCLVLEEAHSLVPEWNNIANDADRNATNGTARAILQGRKYGFGCLLVTQRTANVTKTILNQCNTVFAMRTFDDTGKAFLANYLGSTYADILPTLDEREAVFFGKASSCGSPIRVRLNDRDDFVKRFRKTNPPRKPLSDEVLPSSPENTSISDSSVHEMPE